MDIGRDKDPTYWDDMNFEVFQTDPKPQKCPRSQALVIKNYRKLISTGSPWKASLFNATIVSGEDAS